MDRKDAEKIFFSSHSLSTLYCNAESRTGPGYALLAYLVLDEELDTLDGGSSSLGDSSGNTTHCYDVSYCCIKSRQFVQSVGID